MGELRESFLDWRDMVEVRTWEQLWNVAELKYAIGVDLGQRQDHTALTVVERVVELGETDRVTWMRERKENYNVRYVSRLPLGTEYREVVHRVRWLVQRPELAGRTVVVVDATGVGVPVVEMLRAAQLGVNMHAVTITSGGSETYGGGAGPAMWRVPKRDLVAAVAMLLEERKLRISGKMPMKDALVREMMNFRAEVRPSGGVVYESWRERDHDDMVLAVALACWWLRREAGVVKYDMFGRKPLF
ncbi:MAG: hypothetical protein L0170_19965 [Acidobacteria bacterium]|nr:hypothetical protein [Acidobacteriota bacterium]